MSKTFRKGRFAHFTLLIAIIFLSFLANLKSAVAQDTRQRAILHSSPLPLPDPVPYGEYRSLDENYWPHLAAVHFDNDASSACVTGIQIFYDQPDFNAQRGLVEYIYGPTSKCENLKYLRGKVSSARHAGLASDFLASTLTLYQWDYFQGVQELTEVDLPSLNLDGQVTSIIITGEHPWTLYSQPNYGGEAVCIRAEYPTPAFIYDVTKMGLTESFVRSVRRGCFAPTTDGGGGGYPNQVDFQYQQGQNSNQGLNENQIQSLIQSEIQKQVSGLVQSPSPPLTRPGPGQTNYPTEIEVRNLIQTEIAKQVLALMQSQTQMQMLGGTTGPNYPNGIQTQTLIQSEIQKQILALQQAQNQVSNNVISGPAQSIVPNPSQSALSESQIQALIQTEIQKQVQALKQAQDQMSNLISGQVQSSTSKPAQDFPSESQIQALIQTEVQKQVEALKEAQQDQMSNVIPGQSSTPSPSLIQEEIQKQVAALAQVQGNQTPNVITSTPAPNSNLNIANEIQNQVMALMQSQTQTSNQNSMEGESPVLTQSTNTRNPTEGQVQNEIQSEIQNQIQALLQAQNQNQNLNPAQPMGSQLIDPTQIQMLIQSEIQNQIRDILVSQNRGRFEQSNLFPREGGFPGGFPSSIRNPYNFLNIRFNYPFNNNLENRIFNNNFSNNPRNLVNFRTFSRSTGNFR